MFHSIGHGAYFEVQHYTILNENGTVNKEWIEGVNGVLKIVVLVSVHETYLTLLILKDDGSTEMYTRG